MSKEIAVKTMPKADARAFVESIKKRVGDIRKMLIELHDRLGWEALGYDSWDKCVTKEFGWSKRYANMQISAGKIEQKLLAAPTKVGTKVPTQSPISPIQETHLRPLASLPEDQQIAAYQDAKEEAAAAGETLTAAAVKAKADLYKPAAPKPQPAAKKCPKCGGTDFHEDDTCASCVQEEDPPPADKTKARKLLGQLVRLLDALGIDWGNLTLQQIKDGLRS